tara:strand:+ start:768 stop:1202 length:435 start_codon:yes stop_codon:yes gene_type:complete
MAVEVVVKKLEYITEFPKLMKSSRSGNVVFFERPNVGILISKGSETVAWPHEPVRSDISMDHYRDFEGEVTLETDQENQYPTLKESEKSGSIIYFVSTGIGVVVKQGNKAVSDKVGHSSSNWGMWNFSTIDIRVVLSNKKSIKE